MLSGQVYLPYVLTRAISVKAVYIPDHNLERGKKVEIVLVSKNGSLRRISRMMGIVIRIDPQGAAMVTYIKDNMNSQQELLSEEQLLKQEFGEV